MRQPQGAPRRRGVPASARGQRCLSGNSPHLSNPLLCLYRGRLHRTSAPPRKGSLSGWFAGLTPAHRPVHTGGARKRFPGHTSDSPVLPAAHAPLFVFPLTTHVHSFAHTQNLPSSTHSPTTSIRHWPYWPPGRHCHSAARQMLLKCKPAPGALILRTPRQPFSSRVLEGTEPQSPSARTVHNELTSSPGI